MGICRTGDPPSRIVVVVVVISVTFCRIEKSLATGVQMG